MNALLRGAHELAERDFRVIPLKPRSKTPAINKWQERATAASTQIDRWWAKWPDANVAVATGNGLIVVDLDSADAHAYARELGLPDTPSVRTGRTGMGLHLYFSGSGPNSKGKIHPKIDVRGQGGYVVAPPSVHDQTGALYEWIIPPGQPLAALPEWAVQENSTQLRPQHVEGTYVEGERNEGLHKLGSAMRGMGVGFAEIEAALLSANDLRCEPPLDPGEVRKIAQSVLRYPVGWSDDKIDLLICRDVGASAMAVYTALRYSCGTGDRCFQSQEGLSGLTGLKSNQTINNAVKALVATGLIEKISRRQPCGLPKANAYRLLSVKDSHERW